MLAGMGNISSHHNSLFYLVPPITTSHSGQISCSQFLLLSSTNENPPQVGSLVQVAARRGNLDERAFHHGQAAGAERQMWSPCKPCHTMSLQQAVQLARANRVGGERNTVT